MGFSCGHNFLTLLSGSKKRYIKLVQMSSFLLLYGWALDAKIVLSVVGREAAVRYGKPFLLHDALLSKCIGRVFNLNVMKRSF